MKNQGVMRRVVLVGMFAAALANCSCGPRATQAPPPTERAVAWRRLGSWSGRGSLQTESFTSDTGTLRVRWDTTSSAAPGTATAGAGMFRLEAHSAISGRLLQEVVDHSGTGGGVGYVQQDPHVFYIVVESAQLNWEFTVEEAIGYP